MVTKIYIGESRLDLFEDEDITLNSSIASVSDITKNTTDYTKSFTVPASDINNEVFKHYYDANIDGGFDARVKQDGRIELDGIHFKYGKFRLNSVSIKNGQPSHYNINFWGNLVTLKDKLKNDELSALDLSSLDHAFNSTNVKTGLTTGLFSGDLVYNLLAKKQYYYNGVSSDNTQEDLLANIAFGGGSDTGVIWRDLSPSIRLLNIIEAIETDYDITFSRDFFGRAEFTNLFMYVNNKTELNNTAVLVDFDGGDNDFIDFATDTGTYPINTTVYRWRFDVDIRPDTGFESAIYTVKCEINGEIYKEQTFAGGDNTFVAEIDRTQTEESTLIVKFYVESPQDFDADIFNKQRFRQGGGFGVPDYDTTGSVSISSFYEITNNLPKIKILDFLTGLFKAFKLVIIPLDDGTLYVNTLNDYYSEGSVINATEYVDTNNYDVARGNILNEIIFGFEEPSTLLNIEFEKNTGDFYGDEDTFLYDDNNELLDGDKYEYKLPFEQVVYERLTDQVDNVQTNIQYGAILDEEGAATKIKAHIFYNVNVQIGSKKIGFIDDAGNKTDLGNFINTPSHSETMEFFDYSFLFSEEFSTWNGTLTSKNLYTNYHSTYIDSIFNIKRRNFKFNAKNFPLKLLTELSLNDVIEIKNNYYRIDNFNINLMTGEVEFNLINSFDNTVLGYFPDQTSIVVDYQIQQASIYVVNLGNSTATKVDTGDGTTWVTVSQSGNNVYFDFNTENNTGYDRFMDVELVNNDTLQEFTVELQQTPKRITADNNIITADDNVLTADNN